MGMEILGTSVMQIKSIYLVSAQYEASYYYCGFGEVIP